MSEWSSMSLEDAGVTLIDCVHATPKAAQSGYPYIAIPQMKDGRIDFSTARRISHQDFLEWTKKARPQKHDIVLSRRTNPGVTASVGDKCDFALGQNLVLLRADGTRVLPQFLRWLVLSPAWWQQIDKYNNAGAIFDSLKCADVPRFELPIPPKQDQLEITKTLGALDDKIELNRRMNETLEAMAQAIFRDWFVDFGPTRRKLAGITDPVEIMGGLVQDTGRAAELVALFPSRLAGDGSPEDWMAGRIGDLSVVNPESWSNANYPAEIEYVDLANTKWGIIEKAQRYKWADAPSRARRVVRPGDTIVGTVRPGNGSFAYVGRDGLTASTGFAVIRATEPALAPLIYCALTQRDNIDRLASLADGGAYPAVRPEIVADSPIAGANKRAVLTAFGKIGAGLLAKVVANLAECETLAATRDLLLPKLMSGEIRLRDAEAMVEAAQ